MIAPLINAINIVILFYPPWKICGILSDTLILQSATTTEVDIDTAEYLSSITNLDIKELGNEILLAGSRIKGRDVGELIRQDMKEYFHHRFA